MSYHLLLGAYNEVMRLLALPTKTTKEERTALADAREAAYRCANLAWRMASAQRADEYASNPHILDNVVKWMRARHPMGSDLAQIAEEFTGGNLVVAKRVLDALVDLKLVLVVNRARDAYWMLAFDWKDPNEVPVPEGRS